MCKIPRTAGTEKAAPKDVLGIPGDLDVLHATYIAEKRREPLVVGVRARPVIVQEVEEACAGQQRVHGTGHRLVVLEQDCAGISVILLPLVLVLDHRLRFAWPIGRGDRRHVLHLRATHGVQEHGDLPRILWRLSEGRVHERIDDLINSFVAEDHVGAALAGFEIIHAAPTLIPVHQRGVTVLDLALAHTRINEDLVHPIALEAVAIAGACTVRDILHHVLEPSQLIGIAIEAEVPKSEMGRLSPDLHMRGHLALWLGHLMEAQQPLFQQRPASYGRLPVENTIPPMKLPRSLEGLHHELRHDAREIATAASSHPVHVRMCDGIGNLQVALRVHILDASNAVAGQAVHLRKVTVATTKK
mmetsp:Transcript_46018/g.95730  ORF Transcript_46018/g.95730 Transcript_46018/m.95730 type:complete len:359 (+) Transcript_46018:219-1295(+)